MVIYPITKSFLIYIKPLLFIVLNQKLWKFKGNINFLSWRKTNHLYIIFLVFEIKFIFFLFVKNKNLLVIIEINYSCLKAHLSICSRTSSVSIFLKKKSKKKFRFFGRGLGNFLKKVNCWHWSDWGHRIHFLVKTLSFLQSSRNPSLIYHLHKFGALIY